MGAIGEHGASATDPRVRVVVLNWNSAWYTRRCLESLTRTDYPADRMELVLVDNGSVDGSLPRLRDWFPDLAVVENFANLGFAEGCNRAMRDRSGLDAIALLNNDAMVDPGWLRALTDALALDDRIGAVSARLVLEPGFVAVDVHADGIVEVQRVCTDGVDVTAALRVDGFDAVSDSAWPLDVTHRLQAGSGRLWVPAGAGVAQVEVHLSGSGSVRVEHDCRIVKIAAPGIVAVEAGSERIRLLNGIGTARNSRCEGYDRHYGVPEGTLAEERESVVEVDGVCGGAALLRTRMLDEVGLFDPRLFAYYEDTDLSWRAVRAGWRMVAAPGARVEHAFGASGGARAVGFFHLDRRNWWLTADRNGTVAERRHVSSEVRREVRTALRANIAGRIKRRHLPSLQLLRAWAGIVADHAAELRRRSRSGSGSASSGSAPIGSARTSSVVGRFQPRPRPSVPRPRPWGPLQVHLGVEAIASPVAPAGWSPDAVAVARSLVRSLLQDHMELDVVPTVVDAEGDRVVAGPAHVGRLLGEPEAGEGPGTSARRRSARTGEPIRLVGAVAPATVVLAPGSDTSAVVATIRADAPRPAFRTVEVRDAPSGAADVAAMLLQMTGAERPSGGDASTSPLQR